MGDSMVLLQLLHCVRKTGVRDPNVELFVAVLENRPEEVEKALADGADPNKTDTEVVNYHRALLAKRCPAELRAWSDGGEEGGGTVM